MLPAPENANLQRDSELYMESGDLPAQVPPDGAACFATTHWSVILSARDGASSEAADALERLCRTYWYPLYAYARRRGQDAHTAQDATQGFFARLLEKDFLSHVDREKGKFRSFLLAAFKHFLSDDHDRATAAKRGGGQNFISLNDEEAEERYLHEPATSLSPDKIFDRQWAVTVLDQALERLRQEFIKDGKVQTFEVLKVFLSGEAESGDYAPVAAGLGMSSGAVAVAVHRLRQRYRDLVYAEIANTVADPADIEEEKRHLFAVLTE